jgi:predicted DNA-binding ribbon-helix-helix protein
MKSHLVKRSVVVAGRRVTLDLEDAYWKGLKEMAAWRDMSLPDLIASIGGESSEDIASAIRLFVLNFYRHQLFAADHLLRSVAPLPDLGT